MVTTLSLICAHTVRLIGGIRQCGRQEYSPWLTPVTMVVVHCEVETKGSETYLCPHPCGHDFSITRGVLGNREDVAIL